MGVALFRRSPTRREPGYACMMAGRPDDIAIVRYMWAWLEIEAMRLLGREPRSAAVASGKGKGYRQSWLMGFVSGIRLQLTEARKVAWSDAPTAALAVLTGREKLATEAAERELRLGPGYDVDVTATSARGFYDGRARGHAVALDETLPAPVSHALPAKAGG